MRVKQKFAIISGFIFGLLVLAHGHCLAGSEPNLQEGLWEITSQMEMPGMKMPAMKHNQCITKENAVPESSQPDQECRLIDTSVNGDTVSWNMICKSPEGDSKLAGEITYHGNTFEGAIRIEMQGMQIIQTMNGRRIGECKK